MLTSFMVVAATVAVARRRPVLIGLCALAAGIGKETMPVFLLALGLLAGRDESDGWLPPAVVQIPLWVGCALAALINTGFNVFRFGTPSNANYLRPEYRISHVRAARNFLNLLVSPGGGMIWFWSALVVLFAGLLTVSIARWRHSPRAAAAGLALLAIVGAFMIGLAEWWSPFGWIAWGPRLTVPFMPAAALVAVKIGGTPLARLAASLLRRWRLALIGVVVVSAAAWPEAAAPWASVKLAHLIEIRDGLCASHPPRFTLPYYNCVDYLAWRHDHQQLRVALAGNGPAALAGQIAVVATLALLLLAARRQPLPDAQTA